MPVRIIDGVSIGNGLDISMGRIPGYSVIDKFGENPEIDTGSTPEDIWELGGLYIYDANNTAPIVSLISDNALDTQVISITGLDINGTVYCYIGTGGVPAAADIRALIDNGHNQTLMALYTVPLGKVGFLFRGELGGSRSQNAGALQCAYYSRRVGKVFRIKKRVDITNQGTSIYQDERGFPDPVPALTDIRLTVESVSANNTGAFGTLCIMLVDEAILGNDYLTAIGQPEAMPS